jgi:hypothetical protein
MVEVIATLLADTAHSGELDNVVALLEKSPLVEHASWTSRPSE